MSRSNHNEYTNTTCAPAISLFLKWPFTKAFYRVLSKCVLLPTKCPAAEYMPPFVRDGSARLSYLPGCHGVVMHKFLSTCTIYSRDRCAISTIGILHTSFWTLLQSRSYHVNNWRCEHNLLHGDKLQCDISSINSSKQLEHWWWFLELMWWILIELMEVTISYSIFQVYIEDSVQSSTKCKVRSTRCQITIFPIFSKMTSMRCKRYITISTNLWEVGGFATLWRAKINQF